MKNDRASSIVMLKVMVAKVYIFAAFGWCLILCYEQPISAVDVVIRQ